MDYSVQAAVGRKALRPLHNQRGLTLLMVLIVIVVMGLSLGVAGSTWKTIMQREREKELLFRGDQYRRAIESYYSVIHGARKAYPTSLEDLLEDTRTTETTRHIRKLYKDPMTGEDFIPVRQAGKIGGTVQTSVKTGAIIGVRSSSDLEPFKKDGFDEEYEDFVDAEKYSDWEFVYRPEQTAVPKAGNPPASSTLNPATSPTPNPNTPTNPTPNTSTPPTLQPLQGNNPGN